MMHNDLLPSPDFFTEPPTSEDPRIISVEIAAAGLGRTLVTEYAGINGEPEAQRLLSTIARSDAAVGEPPRHAAAALSRGLGDLAALIERIESMLQADETSESDVHFAVEHIQDIAMALRQRDVEPSLCDTLEAAVRDVGDAIVRSEAAAARALSAAVLLRDLGWRVDALTAAATSMTTAAVEPLAEAVTRTANEESAAAQFDNTAAKPMNDFVDAVGSHVAHAVSLLRPAPVLGILPDNEATPRPKEEPANLSEPLLSPELSLPNVSQQAVQARKAINDVARQLVLAAQMDGLVAAETDAMVPQPAVAMKASASINARATPDDPLAPLYALSEEELIALFS